MTEENYNRATEILTDIRVLQLQTISNEASEELFDEWRKWNLSKIDKLKREFEEL